MVAPVRCTGSRSGRTSSGSSNSGVPLKIKFFSLLMANIRKAFSDYISWVNSVKTMRFPWRREWSWFIRVFRMSLGVSARHSPEPTQSWVNRTGRGEKCSWQRQTRKVNLLKRDSRDWNDEINSFEKLVPFHQGRINIPFEFRLNFVTPLSPIPSTPFTFFPTCYTLCIDMNPWG